jgi:hypothetical protein
MFTIHKHASFDNPERFIGLFQSHAEAREWMTENLWVPSVATTAAQGEDWMLFHAKGKHREYFKIVEIIATETFRAIYLNPAELAELQATLDLQSPSTLNPQPSTPSNA